MPLPLKSDAGWVSDTTDGSNYKLEVIKTLSTPSNGAGNKLLNTIDGWLKAGRCARYSNVGITSIKDALVTVLAFCNSRYC